MIFTLEIRPPDDGPPDQITITPIPNEEHATRYIISVSWEWLHKWARGMATEGWGPASSITDAQISIYYRDVLFKALGQPPVGPITAEEADALMLTDAEVRRHQGTRPATTNQRRAAQ